MSRYHDRGLAEKRFHFFLSLKIHLKGGDQIVVKVVKRSGTTEPFQRLKVVKSCTAAGAPADVAARIGDEIEKIPRDEMPTSEIRAAVLEKLRVIRPEWAKAWEEYDAKKGKKK